MRAITANSLRLSHFVFYLAVTGLYVYGFAYDTDLFRSGKYKKVGFPFDDSFNGRAKFLTYNNMFLQTIFFGLSALGAFLSIMKSTSHLKVRRISNFLYTSLAFPIGVLVSVAFWSIYAIDRKLIYPEILDTIIPVWLNQILHTLPLVSLLIEAYVTKHSYTTFLRGALYNAIFMAAYILWTLYIAYHSDNWVYAVMKVLSPLHRGMFILCNCLFSIFLYKVGELLNSIFWSVHIKNY